MNETAEPEEELDSEFVPDEMLQAMRDAAGEATKLLRSIGSPYRLMILCLLMDSEKTVTEISDAIGARQSLTSQHLTHLRLHGLVKVERRGHFAYYSLNHDAARDIVATLYKHYCSTGLPSSE
jgi:DNA-binding transcriptional ArsR family regulator